MINVGFISGPFGIKGEIKVISNVNHLDKIFKIGNSLYINNQKYIIKNSHIHKNNYLLLFNELDNINKLDNILKKDIYIKREDINLNNNEYLNIELINCRVIDNKEIGIVKEVLFNKKDLFIKLNNNIIIPLVDKYLVKVDINNKIIYVKNSNELKI